MQATYVCLFVTSFAIVDALYSLKNNTKESYRLYTRFPKPMYYIDSFLEH